MGRTWGEHGKSVCGGGDVGTWEGHGETWEERVWGDVGTWEGHGETWEERVGGDVRTWEGHGETWKERVCVWGDMERYRVT